MFSPRIYWRLFASLNEAWWPTQLLLVGAPLIWLIKRSVQGAAARGASLRAAAVFLALCWLLTATAFLQQRFAPINWVASGYAVVFMLQAIALLALAAVGGINAQVTHCAAALASLSAPAPCSPTHGSPSRPGGRGSRPKCSAWRPIRRRSAPSPSCFRRADRLAGALADAVALVDCRALVRDQRCHAGDDGVAPGVDRRGGDVGGAGGQVDPSPALSARLHQRLAPRPFGLAARVGLAFSNAMTPPPGSVPRGCTHESRARSSVGSSPAPRHAWHHAVARCGYVVARPAHTDAWWRR
jgi:hypothetical protein